MGIAACVPSKVKFMAVFALGGWAAAHFLERQRAAGLLVSRPRRVKGKLAACRSINGFFSW